MKPVVEALEAIGTDGTCFAEQTLPAKALHLSVKGIGPISLPLTPAVVKALIETARPARYGLRDKTLLDKRVRNCWEIPASRLKLEGQDWQQALQGALDELAIDLGLPGRRKASVLQAHPYNLLIYGRGQFSRPHQDTGKLRGMVATLVVVLPSPHQGGALVIEHLGEKQQFQGAPARGKLKLIAFYADCHHELRPVRNGYRVALTFNLTLGDAGPSGEQLPSARLTEALRQYFRTPQARRFYGREARKPGKWAFLLDHEYTQSGLGWARLKNGDRVRAGVLAKVARELDLEIYLALADIQETWMATDDDRDWDPHAASESDEEDEEESNAAGGAYHLEDFIEDHVELSHFIDLKGRKVDVKDAGIEKNELCSLSENRGMKPYREERGLHRERRQHPRSLVSARGSCAHGPGQGKDGSQDGSEKGHQAAQVLTPEEPVDPALRMPGRLQPGAQRPPFDWHPPASLEEGRMAPGFASAASW